MLLARPPLDNAAHQFDKTISPESACRVISRERPLPKRLFLDAKSEFLMFDSVSDWVAKRKLNQDEGIEDALREVYAADTISKRFDAFNELISCCEKYLKDSADLALKPEVERLAKQAKLFAKAVVNAKDPADFEKKVARRKLAKGYAKLIDFMPWTNPWQQRPHLGGKKENLRQAIRELGYFSLKKHNKALSAENRNADKEAKVHYYSKEKREIFRVLVVGNKLKKLEVLKKEKAQTQEAERLVLYNLDTQTYTAHGKDEKAIFVISPNGEYFVGNTVVRAHHHSSFLSGGEVFFAGTLQVSQGILRGFTNYSGHYGCSFSHSIRTMAHFRRLGLLKQEVGSNQVVTYTDVVKNKQYNQYNLCSQAAEMLPLSPQERKQLVAIIDGYIASRVTLQENGKFLLHKRMRFFFDCQLTIGKIRLACNLKQALQDATTREKTLEAIGSARTRHAQMERVFQKTYWFGMGSDLVNTLNLMESYLKNSGSVQEIQLSEIKS